MLLSLSSRRLAVRFVAPLLVALTLFVETARGDSSATLTVRLEPGSVVAEGVSPKGEVVLFGVSHESVQYRDVIQRWTRVAADEDGDGRVAFVLDAPIQPSSVWVVVDIRSGDHAVITPEGYQLPVAALPASAFRRGAKAEEVEAVELTGAAANIVVVRRAVGAWRMNVEQDGRFDEDQLNPNVIRVTPGALTPLAGNAPPPRVLTPGDLVLIIHPYQLRFTSGRVAK